MQVSNSSNSFPIQGQQIPDNQTINRASQAENRQEVLRERETRTEQANNPQRIERIEVDQRAISQLEQDAAQRQTDEQNTTSYDSNSQRNNTAIAAYQSVSSIEQRANVQQLLGVDIYT